MEVPKDIDTLYILEGKYLTDCVKVYNLHKLDFVNTVPGMNLNLFKSKSTNKYICTIKDYNMLLSSEIVELLKPYLMVSQDVTAVQTKPLNEYQSFESTSKDCIIRMVCTTNPPPKELYYVYPKLEQPNFVSGVSAGGNNNNCNLFQVTMTCNVLILSLIYDILSVNSRDETDIRLESGLSSHILLSVRIPDNSSLSGQIN